MEFVSSEKGDGWSTVCHMHRFRLSADQQKDRLQKRNYHAKLRVSCGMTPAPRPFSGDTEDACTKSQNPLAQSARTQTLIPLMMGFLGMYCLIHSIGWLV